MTQETNIKLTPSSRCSELAEPIGLFGGTFDPVHFGHLHYAQQIAEQLSLSTVHLLPAKIPPHKKSTISSSQHRVAMLKQVCLTNPLFKLNTSEIEREQTSYTVLTLQHLSQTVSHAPIYFFIGMDSLCQLNQWYHWQELLDYCHLVVTDRPGYKLPSDESELAQYINSHLITDKSKLETSRNGYIYFAQTDNLEISSTAVRERLSQGKNCQYLVPEKVLNYINKHQLY